MRARTSTQNNIHNRGIHCEQQQRIYLVLNENLWLLRDEKMNNNNHMNETNIFALIHLNRIVKTVMLNDIQQ